MKLKIETFDAGMANALGYPNLANNLIVVDEDHNDQPIICGAVPACSDYTPEQIEVILRAMVDCFNHVQCPVNLVGSDNLPDKK